MKKRLLSVTLAMILLMGTLAACSKPGDASGSQGQTPAAKTPEELRELYSQAITSAGVEMVEYNPVVTDQDEIEEYMLELVGLKNVPMDALAMSVSMMNVQAYGIVAAKPAAGSEQAVQDGLQGFIDLQQTSFESYLPDQYEISLQAKLEVLSDGTVLMVMCEDSDTVFKSIKEAIEA